MSRRSPDTSSDVPAIVVTSKAAVLKRRPIDPIARAKFLDVLAQTGSRAAAAAAARPHLRSKASALSVFTNHMEANPAFAAQVADVEAHVAGIIDREIYKRALEGVVTHRKYGENGEIKEERIEHDNKLLLRLARNVGKRVDSEAWAPDEKVMKVEGGTRNLTVSMDVDRLLEEMPTEAIRAMLSAAEKARALSGPVSDEMEAEDAEVVDPLPLPTEP